jgi:glycerol kinase
LHYLRISFIKSEKNQMKRYILALDQGTTSSRAIVFNNSGLPVATAQKEFMQNFPEPGWVEHNAEEIWSTQAGVAIEAMTMAGIESSDIAGHHKPARNDSSLEQKDRKTSA